MPFIQVPPDSIGKMVDTVTPASSAHRQVVTIGDPASTGSITPVTSSGGLQVTAYIISTDPSAQVTSSYGVMVNTLSRGCTPFTYVSSSSANVNSVRTSGVFFVGFYAFNNAAAIRYLKIYNSSSAPTIGSTALQVGNYGLPYSTGASGAYAQHMFDTPMNANNGLAFTIVSGIQSTSTGSIDANEIGLTLYYI